MGVMDVFQTIILVQLFFSFAITTVTYAMPNDTIQYVEPFTEVVNQADLSDTANQVQSSLERQTNLPLIDIGALAFYSGNIILDLIVNFLFAIPSMITLVLNAFFMIFSLESGLTTPLYLFASVAVSVWYLISIIQFVASLRTGRQIG